MPVLTNEKAMRDVVAYIAKLLHSKEWVQEQISKQTAEKAMRKTNTMKMALAAAIALGVSIATSSLADHGDKQFFDPSEGKAPFSRAVRVGDTLYLSGALGIKDRQLAEGGVGPETAQALENIKASLAEHGLGMEDVVKCTVFLADIADFSAMNEVYMQAFAPPRPARSALGVSGLALQANVEIECLAAF